MIILFALHHEKNQEPCVIEFRGKLGAPNELQFGSNFRSMLPGCQWLKMVHNMIGFTAVSYLKPQLCKTGHERDTKMGAL